MRWDDVILNVKYVYNIFHTEGQLHVHVFHIYWSKSCALVNDRLCSTYMYHSFFSLLIPSHPGYGWLR